ncbi:MAG: hypothetical protein JSW01_02805 [Candidatus Bathyarchaeota archaeon]|nr:MAG: hypothetical protein JSW01_02805 [Candidatus Bathyarchaeota archaeon]
MDHVVYLDAKAKEMERILDGTKTMIIRGAAGRKLPYGRVKVGDTLFFINNNAEGMVKALGVVSNVFNSEKMTKKESSDLVNSNQDKLQLTDRQMKRWAGKRYIVLIEVVNAVSIKPFKIDKSDYGNMDDWLLVGDISKVKET